jgi:hypothetical protein
VRRCGHTPKLRAWFDMMPPKEVPVKNVEDRSEFNALEARTVIPRRRGIAANAPFRRARHSESSRAHLKAGSKRRRTARIDPTIESDGMRAAPRKRYPAGPRRNRPTRGGVGNGPTSVQRGKPGAANGGIRISLGGDRIGSRSGGATFGTAEVLEPSPLFPLDARPELVEGSRPDSLF